MAQSNPPLPLESGYWGSHCRPHPKLSHAGMRFECEVHTFVVVYMSDNNKKFVLAPE